jgi:hypothetical protein
MCAGGVLACCIKRRHASGQAHISSKDTDRLGSLQHNTGVPAAAAFLGAGGILMTPALRVGWTQSLICTQNAQAPSYLEQTQQHTQQHISSYTLCCGWCDATSWDVPAVVCCCHAAGAARGSGACGGGLCACAGGAQLQPHPTEGHAGQRQATGKLSCGTPHIHILQLAQTPQCFLQAVASFHVPVHCCVQHTDATFTPALVNPPCPCMLDTASGTHVQPNLPAVRSLQSNISCCSPRWPWPRAS